MNASGKTQNRAASPFVIASEVNAFKYDTTLKVILLQCFCIECLLLPLKLFNATLDSVASSRFCCKISVSVLKRCLMQTSVVHLSPQIKAPQFAFCRL